MQMGISSSRQWRNEAVCKRDVRSKDAGRSERERERECNIERGSEMSERDERWRAGVETVRPWERKEVEWEKLRKQDEREIEIMLDFSYLKKIKN